MTQACASTEKSVGSTDLSALKAPPQPAGLPSDSLNVAPSAADRHAYLTVRELMRLESEQALAAARERRHRGQGAVPGPGVEMPGASLTEGTESLRLIGIYGVGNRLFAEVRSASNAWLFLSGHRMPVGHTAGAQAYQLKEIAGACVRLEREGTETVLCLPKGGRQ